MGTVKRRANARRRPLRGRVGGGTGRAAFPSITTMVLAVALVAALNPCAPAVPSVACPDLIMRRPYNMHLVRSPRGRKLLAATNAIVNVGDGPLEIRGRRRDEDTMVTRQVLRPRTPRGRPLVLAPSGELRYYDTRTRGTYWKYHGAASFTLRRLTTGGRILGLVRTGPKVDYCFRDLRRVLDPLTGVSYRGAPRLRRYGACSTTERATRLTLGTSVGWADIYPYDYPQNAIDVTGLRGCFLYTLKADPKDELRELREDNNAASVVVRLPWRGAAHRGCATPASG